MATLQQFMAAISGQESGGDFTAENLHSGAYGQYQIMPYNWPNWAEEAGLGRDAPQTQGNQNIVAAFKMQQYYDQFGNWGDVASAWYSGSPTSYYTPEELNRKQYTDGNEYPSIQEYVNSVLGRLGESGGGTMSYTPELPFSDAEYQQKVARYLYLDKQLQAHDPLVNPLPNYDALLQEWSQVAAEIQSYDTAMAQGGTGIDDEIARGRYQWETDPRRIDAENSANAWARQQTINQQALGSTQTDLAEQRATADAASAETQAYTSSSHFTQPMGFRVGSTDLPTEEELFAKNIERASKNLPEVTPIPYAPALGAFGAPRAPGTEQRPTQSFGKMPTEADLRAALGTSQPAAKPFTNQSTSYQTPGSGPAPYTFSSQTPSQSAFGRRFTSPMDLVRNALADSQRSPTPTASRLPTPSVAPAATGTPTPYSSVNNNSPLAGGVRRFVGSLFNGRRY